jgi:hypothetical protein
MHLIRWSRSAVLAVATLITVTGCRELTTAPTEDVVVRTAQAVYLIPPGSNNLTIEATVTNTMDRALLLDGIGRDFFGLEKWETGSWRPAYSAVHTLVAVPPLELAPGGSRPVSFGLYVGGAPNTYPKFAYPIPGTYRAVFGFAVEHEGGFRIYSNPFELRVAE